MMDGWMMCGLTDEWMDGWMDAWIDGKMDGWVDGCMDALLVFSLALTALLNSQAVLLIKNKFILHLPTAGESIETRQWNLKKTKVATD